MFEKNDVTTGIRTIGQEGGTFRLNGQPAMLNGAQIMGYRMPADKLAVWNLCPPDSVLAEEILIFIFHLEELSHKFLPLSPV